jgi:hypothetical protein
MSALQDCVCAFAKAALHRKNQRNDYIHTSNERVYFFLVQHINPQKNHSVIVLLNYILVLIFVHIVMIHIRWLIHIYYYPLNSVEPKIKFLEFSFNKNNSFDCRRPKFKISVYMLSSIEVYFECMMIWIIIHCTDKCSSIIYIAVDSDSKTALILIKKTGLRIINN